MGRNQKKTIPHFIPQNWPLILILFLAILGTYYKSLPYPFLNLDDPYYINNPYIRDLTWKGIYGIFSKPIVDNYFPLQILSYAIDYQIWHVQPFGYRLHNVVLHVLNAALVFLLLKKIFSHTWVSFAAALFFGLHPVNVESVTWVAERKNVLSTAFLLSSFLFYLYYLDEPTRSRKLVFYLLCLFLFLLGLLAKVSAVVLPVLFLLFDFCFRERKKRDMFKDKIPFFILTFFFSVLTIWIYHTGKYLVNYHGGSSYSNFLAMINVFVEYIIYLIVPVYLDHFYYTPIPRTIFEPQVLLSLGAILLFIILAWRSFQRDRIFFFWLGWFFISLLPVLNIVPITILRADRYMYLPAIGFFYLVSWGLWKISQREFMAFRLPVLLFGLFLIAGTYAFLTLERNKLWRDSVIFWEESLKKFPQSVMPYKYIGNIYVSRGKNDLAISYFQAGLSGNPNDVMLLNGLAMAHKGKNDLQKAEDLLLRANRLNPLDSATSNNLGTIYFQRGEMEKARSCMQKALEIDPQNASARANLGAVFYQLKQWEEAIRELEKAIEISPGSIEPYLNLALIYEQMKLLGKAESCLQRGLEYVPESNKAFFLMGRISFEERKISQAKYYLSQASRVNPSDPNTNYLLGLIAQNEANHYFQKAGKTHSPPQPKVKESTVNEKRGAGDR
jgi:tetratricopeptide (TPR) repeat protein